MGRMVEIRELVKNAIVAAKAIDVAQVPPKEYLPLAYRGFDIDTTYLPSSKLEALQAGKVWVIGLGGDDKPNVSRAQTVCLKEIPIQIGIQRQIEISNKTAIDEMVTLEEQLRMVVMQCAASSDLFSWIGTDCMKDPEGTPYSYMGMRQISTFEAFFTARFQTTVFV